MQNASRVEKKLAEPRGTPPGPLSGLIGYHMRMAHAAVFQDFRDRLGRFGITPAHLGVLLVVAENRHISQTDLSKALRVDRSALVAMIDKLEAKRFIKRGKPAADRRRNELRLTPEGGKLLEDLWPTLMEHEAAVTARLNNQERETLLELLMKVCGSTESK